MISLGVYQEERIVVAEEIDRISVEKRSWSLSWESVF